MSHTTPPRHAKNSLRRCATQQEGAFSLVEALFALVVTSIGFAALFSMQKTQMSSSISARELAAASNLAERVVSQLHKESFMWTAITRPGPHLNTEPQTWHTWSVAPLDHNMQPNRRDSAQGTQLNQQRFCVHYWLNPLGGLYEGLINARVQVVWPRDVTNTTLVGQLCAEGSLDRMQGSPNDWLTLTVPAIIRRHPL